MPEAGENPCTVRIETPAGIWRVDALALLRAVEADPAGVIETLLRFGCPVRMSESAAVEVIRSLQDAERIILGRMAWLCELAEFYRPLNIWGLEEWQARVMHADLPRRRAIRELQDAERTGEPMGIDYEFHLLSRIHGEERAEAIMSRAGRFDKGLPSRLLEKDREKKHAQAQKRRLEQAGAAAGRAAEN